ncbi:MAG TPA: chromate resistance protein ChrB domain-containing protein [Burkholderiales bacterium]|nr:chromate resistance protein ChrB domain-containing protein [Burkholderiales bacterium]
MDAATSASFVSASEVLSAIEGGEPPLIIDVRQEQTFRWATDMIAGALWRDPERVTEWAGELPRASRVVACCVRGHEVSRGVARALVERGIAAQVLEGGIEEGWKPAGAALDRKAAGANTRWVTRERPKIDRIACPWLIARFVDPGAEFIYVPAKEVLAAAKASDATPYDVPDVHFSHEGERCSFDAFLKHYRLTDPALEQLALIVRGADTARLDLAPQAAGLAAISLGLSRNFADDHQMLKHGLVMYDALYAWCKSGQDEVHTWKPAAYR